MMRPLLAYVTTLCDPLTGLTRRVQVERNLAEALVADPVRSSIYLAGLLRPLVLALPADDPWRQVAVRLGDGRVSPADDPEAAPDTPGAVAAGSTFGRVEDYLDLQPRGALDLSDDLALAGLAEPVPLTSSYLVAVASHGTLAELAAAVLDTIQSPSSLADELPDGWAELVPGEGSAAAHVVGTALRRVLARYRAYVGDGGVSGETPQLAYELDFWVADLTVPDGPGTAVAVDAALSSSTTPPPELTAGPVPGDSYAKFRLP